MLAVAPWPMKDSMVPFAATNTRFMELAGAIESDVFVVWNEDEEVLKATLFVAYTTCNTSPGFLMPGPNSWILVGPLAHVPAVARRAFHSM